MNQKLAMVALILAAAVLPFLFASCDKESQIEKVIKEYEAATDVIFTEEVKDVTANSAVLYGRFGKYYMDMVMEVGMLISTDSEPTLDNSTKLRGEYYWYAESIDGHKDAWICIEGEDSKDRYLVHVRELLPSTTYYYRAYFYPPAVTNVDIFKFGEVKQFTTLASE